MSCGVVMVRADDRAHVLIVNSYGRRDTEVSRPGANPPAPSMGAEAWFPQDLAPREGGPTP